jgi:hypothetical protein
VSSVEAHVRKWLGTLRDTLGDRHPLLAGDAGAEPVLRALAHDPSHEVRTFANQGLRRIEEKRNAARLGG